MKTNYYSILLALISCVWFTLLACSIILNVCQYREREIYVNPAEYQFVVTDDSITVKDFGKQVGTIKLEGQLKELINQHNK